MKKRVTMDFETRSMVNLKTAGAYKYSLDDSTRPTCLAIKKLGEKPIYFFPFEVINRPWKKLPESFRTMWTNWILEGYEFSGHNAFFETCIYKNILVKRLGWPDIPFRQFRCTAAKAAACALPRALGDAGEAMQLRIQKDRRGYAAMMATCKPTRAWNDFQKAKQQVAEGRRIAQRRLAMFERGEPPMFLEPEAAPDVWQTLYTYCKIDVRAEEMLDEALPDLSGPEQEIWFFNQKLNWRGLPIDLPVVRKASVIMDIESVRLRAELDKVTMGLVTKPGAIASILEFLALDGIELPNLRAKTIDDLLNSDQELDSDMQRLLEIRKALSKSSTKKYQGMLARSNDDGRVRDILMYHGASTGRDTGTGIQPHNFPRGLLKVDKTRPYAAIENVINCDKEMLHLLYGENLSILFSSILRNVIIPTKGKELFVADFSKIEVAVLWWLADNLPGLKVLRAGRDPYIYMASANTGRPYSDFNDESPERQLGKAQVLGCGFGMGWKKFQLTAWDQYRLRLTKKQSKEAVRKYREANENVTELWKKYEAAAINALENEGHVVRAGKCRFILRDRFLWVYLPSGRPLAYRDPAISWRVREYEVETPILNDEGEALLDENGEEMVSVETRYSQPQKTVEFWAVNSKTKKWNQERTWGGTLTENIVQATARDLMMPAMVRLEEQGYEGLLMVHDEGICEKTKDEGNVEEFVKILCEPPSWATGLPLEAKGWKGERYRK